MKYSFLTCFTILSASASAAPRGLRPDGLSGEKSAGRTTADEDPAPNPMSDGAADGTTGKAANPDPSSSSGRDLQGCYGDNNDRSEAWHPNYSAGWTNGHCRLTIDCNSPSYPTELACCKAAYAGQISGSCLMQLPSPPTLSPTDVGGLPVYYPNYAVAWNEAHCINTRPMPSGRPTYSTMLACCKGAYGGQISGKCLSMLPSPPSTSPTSSAMEAEFYYPMYETPWVNSGCSNKLPLPYNNVNDRPNYLTKAACCAGAYRGQVSNACICSLDDAPRVCFTTKTTTITSTIALSDITLPLPQDPKKLKTLLVTLESRIKAILDAALGEGRRVVKVTIKSIGGQSVQRRFVRALLGVGRGLQANTTDVESEVKIESEVNESNPGASESEKKAISKAVASVAPILTSKPTPSPTKSPTPPPSNSPTSSPSESRDIGAADQKGWSNWFGEIKTNAPIFRVKTDKELRKIVLYSGGKVRVTGATHSEDGLVMQRAESNVTLVSLVNHIPEHPDWTPRADPKTGLIRLRAGQSWYEATALYRPHGLVLRERTGVRFFSVGGVVSNPVHGGSKEGGFLHSDVTKMLVMTSSGEVSEIEDEDDLKYWRSSAGQLGIILAVEMQLIRELDQGGSLNMKTSVDEFGSLLTLPVPTPAEIGALVQSVTQRVYTVIATSDHSEFFYDFYQNKLASYYTDFTGPVFNDTLSAQYQASALGLLELYGDDVAFTGGRPALQFPEDLCEFFCVPGTGGPPTGNGTRQCIPIESESGLLCKNPVQVGAALSDLTISTTKVQFEAGGDTTNDGYLGDTILPYRVTSLFIHSRSLPQIFAMWWSVNALVVAKYVNESSYPKIPPIGYVPNNLLEFRFINPNETAVMNPIMPAEQWKAEFDSMYYNSFDTFFPTMDGVPDGLISIEMLSIKGVNDDNVDKYFGLLEESWKNTPSNPLAPYGANIVPAYGNIVPNCDPSKNILFCVSAANNNMPPFKNPLDDSLPCCNPRVPVNVHIAKAWGHDQDPETTPTSGNLVPFQNQAMANAIFGSTRKSGSIGKFNSKIEEYDAAVFSGGALLRWLRPENAEVFEPRKLTGQSCGSPSFVSNPGAECLSGICDLSSFKCSETNTPPLSYRVAIGQFAAPGCSKVSMSLGNNIVPYNALPIDLLYPTFNETPVSGSVKLPVGNNMTMQIPIPGLQDNSAKIADGTFPLILYSHGAGGLSVEGLTQLTALASQGYIVAAISHIGSTLFDFTTIGSKLASGSDCVKDIESCFNAVKGFRAPELTCVLNFLLTNTQQDSKFLAINSNSIGYLGFSTGSRGITEVIDTKSDTDSRVKAAVLLAPANPDYTPSLNPVAVAASISTPTLVMHSANDTLILPAHVKAFWDATNFENTAYKILFAKGTHYIFTDACVMEHLLDSFYANAGCLDETPAPLCASFAPIKATMTEITKTICGRENIDATNQIRKLTTGYAKIFFDHHLKGLEGSLTGSYIGSSSDGLATFEAKV